MNGLWPSVAQNMARSIDRDVLFSTKIANTPKMLEDRGEEWKGGGIQRVNYAYYLHAQNDIFHIGGVSEP